jgi:hypothetical protein
MGGFFIFNWERGIEPHRIAIGFDKFAGSEFGRTERSVVCPKGRKQDVFGQSLSVTGHYPESPLTNIMRRCILDNSGLNWRAPER